MSHAANTSIQDIQNGIGDFVLRPEADRNSLDGYMKLPEQNRLNTCSHGCLIEQGVKTHMTYHVDILPRMNAGIPESYGSGFCSLRQNKKGGDANARPWFRFCRPCRR